MEEKTAPTPTKAPDAEREDDELDPALAMERAMTEEPPDGVSMGRPIRTGVANKALWMEGRRR